MPLKQKVEKWLNKIVYGIDDTYIPSDFALEFVNFIKLVNGEAGEENETPVLHYNMLDQVGSMLKNIANMVFRGAAKTSLFGEYLFLYLGVYGKIPGFGKITLALYVSDSIENGVKNMRKNLEYRWENSEFLQTYIPKTNFTDVRWEFINSDGNVFIVKGYGAKALSLDSLLYTDAGTITIGQCQIGDKIFGPDGKLTAIIQKSEIFHKPMYEIELLDGRKWKVSEDHTNNVLINTNPHNIARWEEQNLTTKELLLLPLHLIKGNSKKGLISVKNTQTLQYTQKKLPVSPYLLGLLLGDGSLKKDGSVVLHAHYKDMAHYLKYIHYQLGSNYVDKRNYTTVSQAIKNIYKKTKPLGIHVHGDFKFIPKLYLTGSIKQRLALLQGLMDTDGTVSKTGRMSFCSNSFALAQGVADLVRSLGGEARIHQSKQKHVLVEIKTDFQIFKLPRKAARFQLRVRTVNRVPIKKITLMPLEPSQCIAVDNQEHLFLTTNYTPTHNTGVRGSKERGERPMLAVLDDLVSDTDAKSATVIANIEDTIYKAVDYALHPKRSKIIWSGTPFNARDPLYKAVESGAWHVNVYPICEHFPCLKKDFRGAWPDRFPFEYVNAKYKKALRLGKIDTFNQELMLRIMSEEDRLITDGDINWYHRTLIVQNKGNFNFYITTDFAVSEEEANDFSVISVWGLNNKGFWFWVDGICKKQTMDKNINDLFRLAQLWSPQSVGIEVSGQQEGFIPWIQQQMLDKNCFFNLASENNKSKPGIRPVTNKMVRFNIVVPWFKAHQMFFPIELKETPAMVECINELQLISAAGIKSKHDDFIDTISMLSNLIVWRPSETVSMEKNENDIWVMEDLEEKSSRMSSYIV